MNPWLIGAAIVAAAALLMRSQAAAPTTAAGDTSTTDSGASSSSDQGGGGGGDEAATADLLAALGLRGQGSTAYGGGFYGASSSASGSGSTQEPAGTGGGAYSYIGPNGEMVTPLTYAAAGVVPQAITSGMVAPPVFSPGPSLGAAPTPTPAPVPVYQPGNIIPSGHVAAA